MRVMMGGGRAVVGVVWPSRSCGGGVCAGFGVMQPWGSCGRERGGLRDHARRAALDAVPSWVSCGHAGHAAVRLARRCGLHGGRGRAAVHVEWRSGSCDGGDCAAVRVMLRWGSCRRRCRASIGVVRPWGSCTGRGDAAIVVVPPWASCGRGCREALRVVCGRARLATWGVVGPLVLFGRACCAAVRAVWRWGWCGGGAFASVELLVPRRSCGRGSRVAVGAVRP